MSLSAEDIKKRFNERYKTYADEDKASALTFALCYAKPDDKRIEAIANPAAFIDKLFAPYRSGRFEDAFEKIYGEKAVIKFGVDAFGAFTETLIDLFHENIYAVINAPNTANGLIKLQERKQALNNDISALLLPFMLEVYKVVKTKVEKIENLSVFEKELGLVLGCMGVLAQDEFNMIVDTARRFTIAAIVDDLQLTETQLIMLLAKINKI